MSKGDGEYLCVSVCVFVSHKLEFPSHCGRRSEYWNVVDERRAVAFIGQCVTEFEPGNIVFVVCSVVCTRF